MKEIPLSELKNQINKKLIMQEEHKTFHVKIKTLSPQLTIYNYSRLSIMEFLNLDGIKFYENGHSSQ